MSKYFTGNGFLSEEGEKLLSSFENILNETLILPDVTSMTESELRTLGCVLSKMIGDKIAEKLQSK